MVRHRALISTWKLEHTSAVFDVVKEVATVIACVCFFSDKDAILELGDALFTVFSFLGFLLNIVDIYTTPNLRSKIRDPLVRVEVFETFIFMVAGMFFFVGCIFYWPGITGKYAVACESIGAWCFVIGSFGFVVAGAFNSFTLGIHAMELQLANREFHLAFTIQKRGIILAIIGSCFFVAGSFMYRTVFNETCAPYTSRYSAQHGVLSRTETVLGSTQAYCLSTEYYGTWLYVIGALFLWAETVLNVIVSPMKARPTVEQDGTFEDAF